MALPDSKVLRLAGGAAVAVVLLLLAGYLAGLEVVVRWRHGDTSDTSPVRWASGPEAPPLPLYEPGSPVRNVVLLLGDGMGFGHATAAAVELEGLGGRLFFQRLPVTGWLSTFSGTGVYSDSAAAATALATGTAATPRHLSATDAGRPLPTLAEAALARGMRVGLVTDSYLWDATVAAFVVHATDRYDTTEVVDQLAASEAHLLVGEAPSDFDPEDGGRDAEHLEALQEPDRPLVRSWEELKALEGPTALALLPSGSVADPARPPELHQLTRHALDLLGGAPGGFFLMVETEETDSGAHNHDLDRVVRGVAALAAATEVAVHHALADGETLVLVTADHETGGLSLLGGEVGERLAIRWSTDSHTANPVPVYAFGPGAGRFAGSRANTRVAPLLAELLGLSLGGAGTGP